MFRMREELWIDGDISTGSQAENQPLIDSQPAICLQRIKCRLSSWRIGDDPLMIVMMEFGLQTRLLEPRSREGMPRKALAGPTRKYH